MVLNTYLDRYYKDKDYFVRKAICKSSLAMRSFCFSISGVDLDAWMIENLKSWFERIIYLETNLLTEMFTIPIDVNLWDEFNQKNVPKRTIIVNFCERTGFIVTQIKRIFPHELISKQLQPFFKIENECPQLFTLDENEIIEKAELLYGTVIPILEEIHEQSQNYFEFVITPKLNDIQVVLNDFSVSKDIPVAYLIAEKEINEQEIDLNQVLSGEKTIHQKVVEISKHLIPLQKALACMKSFYVSSTRIYSSVSTLNRFSKLLFSLHCAIMKAKSNSRFYLELAQYSFANAAHIFLKMTNGIVTRIESFNQTGFIDPIGVQEKNDNKCPMESPFVVCRKISNFIENICSLFSCEIGKLKIENQLSSKGMKLIYNALTSMSKNIGSIRK